MLRSKPCSTPAIVGNTPCAQEGITLPNPTPYRQIIGALQYLTTTRLYISFIVNILSQYMQKPTNLHMKALKRVLRYFKRTLCHGLHVRPCDWLTITGYSDADWACSKDDRWSIAGYCVFLGENLVSWSFKKQSVVSMSNTESEYKALALLSCQIA